MCGMAMCGTLEDMHVSGTPSSKLSRVARTWVSDVTSELVPEAGRFYVSLLSRSLVDLVLVHGCMVLLKNCETILVKFVMGPENRSG